MKKLLLLLLFIPAFSYSQINVNVYYNVTTHKKFNTDDSKDLDPNLSKELTLSVDYGIYLHVNNSPEHKDQLAYFETREFEQQYYQINNEPVSMHWSLIDESKYVAGYLCKKAIGKKGSKNVIAWYSTDINLPYGPHHYGGLPGLIMEMDVDNGRQTMELEWLKVQANENYKDTSFYKGKQTTANEFNTFFQQKLNECEALALQGYLTK